jgi:flagellar assembly protein FliH
MVKKTRAPPTSVDPTASTLDAQPGRSQGRWIRPVAAKRASGSLPAGAVVDDVAAALLCEARKRVGELTELERELEDRIRSRWADVNEEVRRRSAALEEEFSEARRRADNETKDLRTRGEKEGRAKGFREGFSRGREEGHRLGVEEARRDGFQEGKEQAYAEVSKKLEDELASAAAALTQASIEFSTSRRELLGAVQGQVVDLGFAIASKLVKREVERDADVALRNVEKAVELIFRREALVIQVHGEDLRSVEKALAGDPRWAEGIESVDVRAASDVDRGGCRLVSGAGTVDMTLQTQIELIDEALRGMDSASGLPAPTPLAPGAKDDAAPDAAGGAL